MDLPEAIALKLDEIDKAERHPACLKLRALQEDLEALKRAAEIMAAAQPKPRAERAPTMQKDSLAASIRSYLAGDGIPRTVEELAAVAGTQPSRIRQVLKPHIGRFFWINEQGEYYLGDGGQPVAAEPNSQPELFMDIKPQPNTD